MVVEHAFGLARGVVKYGAYVLIAMQATEAIKALAGRRTIAFIYTNLLQGLVSEGDGKVLAVSIIIGLLGVMVGTAGVAWAIGERHLRRLSIQYLAAPRGPYERQLDPKRSSSQLTPSGETNEHDEG